MRLPAEAAWPALAAALDETGYALLPGLLDAGECGALIGLYGEDAAFRTRVDMARHRFGQGEYKYLRYPLPPLVAALRTALYVPLAPLANAWHERLGRERRFPATLDAQLAHCHRAGQARPTPLLLKYTAGDYNRLHQDLYGPLVFPLQATVLLSAPGRDFTGGEFVLVEGRARQQSKAEIVPLAQGDAVVFAVNERPLAGGRRPARAVMRHGVSRLRDGCRFTLGLIFHDAA